MPTLPQARVDMLRRGTLTPVTVKPLTRTFTALLLAAVVVSSCQCDEPLADLVPEIAVAPLTLDLGLVRVGAVTEHTIQIGNRGTGVLNLSSVVVDPIDHGFSLVTAPAFVDPGAAVDVVIRLDPLIVDSFDAALVIDSNDPVTPRVEVPLHAEGGPAHLVITPDPVDFGRVNEGLGAVIAVQVENDGFSAATITAASFAAHADVEGAFVVDTSTLPVVLGPGDATTLPVALLPSASTTALLDPDGVLRDRLRVDANAGEVDHSVDVAVRAEINLAPLAVAVELRSRRTSVHINQNTPITVDGSDTTEPDGDPFTFAWSLVERPADSVAVPVSTTSPQVRVIADALGRYVVRLRATDVYGAFDEADVELLPRDLAVVLTWQATDDADNVDYDLHLVAPGGTLGDYGTCPVDCADVDFCAEFSDEHVDSCRSAGLDCAFANRSPEWGSSGRADDPRLDVDDVGGSGPEVITLDAPADGSYRVSVHACRVGAAGDATITVFDQGTIIGTVGPQRLTADQVWLASVLVRGDGTWNVVSAPGIVDAAPVGLCNQ